MNKILIIDASESDRRLMSGLLAKSGYEPIAVDCLEAAKEEVAKLPPGAVVVAGLKFRGGTAKEFINWLKSEGLKTPVIAIVNNVNTTETYDIMKGGGAIDVVQRPALNKQLVDTIGQYARPENLNLEFDDEIIPRKSEAYRFIANEIETIAATNVNCIVFGESGTGKEQIAKQIYQKSSRIDKPLTIVEAGGAAIVGEHDPTTLRSETYNRIAGYFKNTDGGTIIVKNVHLLNFEKQSVLLHILENDHPDVRVICTAEPTLRSLVAERKFRDSLYYTLRSAEIVIPSVNENVDDIPVLCDYILSRYAKLHNQPQKQLDQTAIKSLMLRSWPGNVRELKNTILMAAFRTNGNVITERDLCFSRTEPISSISLQLRNPENECRLIQDAYRRTKNWGETAKLLGITDKTLKRLRDQYGIDKNGEIQS